MDQDKKMEHSENTRDTARHEPITDEELAQAKGGYNMVEAFIKHYMPEYMCDVCSATLKSDKSPDKCPSCGGHLTMRKR